MEELPKWSAPSPLMSIPGPTKTVRTSDTKPATFLITRRNVIVGFVAGVTFHMILWALWERCLRCARLCSQKQLGSAPRVMCLSQENPRGASTWTTSLETSLLCLRIALEMQGWLFSKLLGNPRALTGLWPNKGLLRAQGNCHCRHPWPSKVTQVDSWHSLYPRWPSSFRGINPLNLSSSFLNVAFQNNWCF